MGHGQNEMQRKNPVMTRRFPPPWTVEELDACFVVTDSAGQKLAYVYFEDAGPSLSDRPRVFDKGQGRPFLDQLLNSNCRELGVKLAVIRPCNGTSN
jgi:hypothetical protein